jgi:hypothetical protein
VQAPDPLHVAWHGRMVRIRHDDPSLRPYWPNTDRLGSAMSLASDVEGQRLVLATTVGEVCRREVRDDGAACRSLAASPREASSHRLR